MDSVDNLLLALHDLYYRLHNHKGETCKDSLLTKWKYFVDHSDHGSECTYAQKARSLFLTGDLEEIRRLLSEVQKRLGELDASS